MSQKDACYDRSAVGAQGDRRQQPNVTKTKGGIKPEVKVVRKRSSEKTKVDEEEWNQRMQIWEKKRERIFGSEWQKSFCEGVRARLRGKKPWVSPVTRVTCSKTLALRRIDSNANSPVNSERCRSNTIDLMHSNNDDHQEQRSFQSTAKCKEDEKLGKKSLETVGLKREISRMESAKGSLPKEREQFKNKLLNSSDSLMEKIQVSEKVEDIILERIDSIDSIAQSSTRFVKTVLSPIQSESECSKQGVEAASSEGTSDEASRRYALAEKSELCLLSEHTLAKKNLEDLEMNIKKELLSPQNSKILLQSKQKFLHKSQNSPEVSDKIKGLLTKPNESKSEREENNLNIADQRTNDNDSGADSVTPEMVKQIKEILERGGAQHQPVKTKEVKQSKMETAKKELKTISSTNISHQQRKLCEEPFMKTPSEFKNKNLLNRSNGIQKLENENLHTNQRSTHAHLIGHEVRSLTKSYIDKTDENRIVKSNTVSRSSMATTMRDLNISPSIVKENKGDDPKFIGTTCNWSTESFITSNLSKERALHAIFSSPDTEIFGNRKKPLVQPSIFIASATFEDSSLEERRMSDVDTRLVFVECVPNESYALRARSLGDESITLLDRSLKDLTDTSKEWYREFHRPIIVSSGESEPENMKSEGFREIIIDRSGCSYDERCQAKISESPDNYHMRRYKVCHDASKCSMKNSRKSVLRDHHNRTKHNRGTAFVESWNSTV